MSRNGNKKPVGFATHIIAGGIAGGCEAVNIGAREVVCSVLTASFTVSMSAARHHQGPNAAFKVWTCSRGESVSEDAHSPWYELMELGYNRQKPGVLLRRARTSLNGRHLWRSTRVSVRSCRVSFQRWPFGSPVSRPTKVGSRTRRLEKLPLGISSSVCTTLNVHRYPWFSFLFSAGLGAGVTEAVAVVTPMEVVKIRLQAQQHSLADPLEAPRYRNAGHAVYTIVREEGISTLYRGVSLTALRQATNQGQFYILFLFLRFLT